MDRYKFTVEFYDEVDKISVINKGYVMADTLIEAAEKIGQYYGEKEIERLYLEPDCDDEIIILNEECDEFDTEWEGPAKNTGW